jgi:serine/threonine-protein kinase RsbT
VATLMLLETSRIAVNSSTDAERAQRVARGMARARGLGQIEVESVALATYELATNLVRYGTNGVMTLVSIEGPRGAGLQIESHDTGPGIADVERALSDGFSTGGGLGGGLPAVRRLMDDFDIVSSPRGTQVIARKWPSRR